MNHWEIIESYKYSRIGCVRDDKVIDYCKNSPDIETAIDRAAMAKDEYGNKHSHQWRIKDYILEELADKMSMKAGEIFNVKNFDELYEIIIKTCVIKSIDSLTVYDTALRLGFYLNKLPEKIYIHAGTRNGVEKVVRNKVEDHFILKIFLPEPFRSCDLTEYELEDLFCVYKDEL